MSINKTQKNLKVFLAAAQDVSIECAKASQIISDLNQQNALMKSLNLQLNIKNWLKLNQSTEIDDWDIFIGILWLDIDTYNNQSALTVNLDRKIINAYKKWKDANISHFLLYRCIRTPNDPLEIDAEKLKKIENVFFHVDPPSLSSMLKHPLSDPVGIRRVYCDIEEFGQYLNRDIDTILYEYAQHFNYNPQQLIPMQEPAAITDIGWHPGNEITFSIDNNHSYVLSVLSIEIENSDELKKNLTHTQFNLLRKRFHEFIHSIVIKQGGDQVKLTECGGLYGFWQNNRVGQAVNAAIQIFQQLPDFDHKKISKGFDHPIKIIIAGSDGLTAVKSSEESLFFYNFNSILDIDNIDTSSNQFFINESLYKQLDEDLQGDFTYRQRISSEPVYHWLWGPQQDQPSILVLGRLFRDIVSKKNYLENILNHTFSKLDQRMLETLSTNIDVIYSGLEQFCEWLSSHSDDDNNKEYSNRLTEYVVRLQKFEDSLWKQFRRRFNQINIHAQESKHFLELLRATNSRRSQLVIKVNHLLSLSEDHADNTSTVNAGKAGLHNVKNLKDLLAKFVMTDELDSLDALSEILFNYRYELAGFIENDIDAKSRNYIIRKLWKLAHIILIEDEHYARQHLNEENPFSISKKLAEGSLGNTGFSRIQKLIQHPKEQVLDYLRQLPATHDVQATTNHSQVIFNCILVAYPDTIVRRYVADKMNLSDLWGVIIHEKVSISILSIVAQNINDSEDEDYVKIFFDCIRIRLVNELNNIKDQTVLADIRTIIMIFLRRDFFVETGYFERLDDLLRLFTKKSETLGVTSGIFNEAIKFLEKKRMDQGAPNTRLPEQVKDLPLPVQRRLAGELAYLHIFVIHPDYRIAQETLRYINAENVERVLYPEINKELMSRLLGREDLFLRQSALMAVLLHPNCDIGFAMPHLLRWQHNESERRRIEQISRDSGANPSIKEYARQLLSRPK